MEQFKKTQGLTSIRVVSARASARCRGWTFVSCPVTIICAVLTEPAEWLTVLVKVTGGQHYSCRNTNATQVNVYRGLITQ